MAMKAQKAKSGIDYAAHGYRDGKCIYGDLSNIEKNRRQLVLKAAKTLCGHPVNTAHYLKGLEAGMKNAGAAEPTARRLRYEVAVVIASYAIAVEVEVPKRGPDDAGGQIIAKEQLDSRTLEAQESWLGLINTARKMRSAATYRKRLREGLPWQAGRGNHTVRKFNDVKFDLLREQLIERTAASQALDLLDAAIIAVTNAHLAIAAEEIDVLRDIEQKIHDKVKARNLDVSVRSDPAMSRLQWLKPVINLNATTLIASDDLNGERHRTARHVNQAVVMKPKRVGALIERSALR